MFRIVEAFQADPRYRIDVRERVTEHSPQAITLGGGILGLRVTRLSHRFNAQGGATHYDSLLEVGFALPLLAPILNRLILSRRFPEAMGHAWIARNIGEVGQLETFLPDLHAAGCSR